MWLQSAAWLLAVCGGVCRAYQATPTSSSANNNKNENKYSGSTDPAGPLPQPQSGSQQAETRRLGSQELLMLPRQYGERPDVRLAGLNHVCVAPLETTPPAAHLERAVAAVMDAHPLLRCRVRGDGEPHRRVDLFRMVRSGDPNPCTFVPEPSFTHEDVLRVVEHRGGPDALRRGWEESFRRDLDDNASWYDVDASPLWKLELHRDYLDADADADAAHGECALLFSFNHAISDQGSANRLIDQILTILAELDDKVDLQNSRPVAQSMPVSVEESVLGRKKTWADVGPQGLSLRTATYVAGKAGEDARHPVILPDASAKGTGNPILAALSTISGRAAGGDDDKSGRRRSVLQFRTMSSETTNALLGKCRDNGVTITDALSAAATLAATDCVGIGNERTYKILQSMDMRRFGEKLDLGESFGCLAGSMDLMHGPLKDGSGTTVSSKKFWKLARDGRDQTKSFIETGGPQEAVRVFDFAMTISDLNNLVHLTAQSKQSQGRAYSAGFTNAGVYERTIAFANEGQKERGTAKTQHGKYKVKDIYYAASNARSGCLYRFSCMTVNGEMKFTFHPAAPIVDEEANGKYADALIRILETMSDANAEEGSITLEELRDSIPENSLVLATAVIGSAAMLSHAGAYASFVNSILEMKRNVDDPAQFWAALNFWIFFAVGHPILQPILWISDVLHGSPGPKVADLVPVSFLAGNAAVIWAVSKFKELRSALNVGIFFAFFAYVGAGLDGAAGLGDFNLAVDDPYKGQIVKGCPAYDEVRQPSMDNFDLEKYQGLWYEHKFHDWTQFKEVYDTTLDIKLTPDGKGWIDDFAVKGPAPDAAPLSWDKSPVANGAHYFLFGRVDEKDPPGVLRESGFGVEFPNYIVDVQKDPKTGEYKEAIQFQCLSRGGVRVFEGINFMSRSPTMSDDELNSMHARAEKAGMYPYGAAPEQMHTVARRPLGAPNLDNSWQAMWRFIGVDKLLQLLTESIEDGGR